VPKYDDLKNKQSELIRKALDGSVFLAPISAAPITTLTTRAAAVVGPPAVPAHNELTALPADWDDLGWLTDDGAAFSRSVSTSDVTSWGSVSPTRSDVTADTTTLAVTAQETKLLTIGLATGVDMGGITPNATTGEVSIAKPTRPSGRFYRALSVAVDLGDAGEIYIGRFLPRAKVTGFSDQAMGGGDAPITWGVTLTGYEDSDLGYSERWLFGGDGWQALLADMGFGA
jgi:hypothetical protein